TEAQEAFQRALDLGIDGARRADVLSAMGAIHHQRGADDSARKLAKEALALNPSDPQALLTTTLLDLAANQLEAARRSAEQMVKLAPTYGLGHALLAGILADSGDARAAQHHIAQARALGTELEFFAEVEKGAARHRWLTLGWQIPLAMLVLIGVGLLTSWLAGRALSNVQLGHLKADDVHLMSSEQTASERRVDRAYNAVLWGATALFYPAVPMMLVITVATAGALLYGVMMLPVIPLKLFVIVGLIGIGGLIAILRGVFTAAPPPEEGRELKPEEAPRLFEALAEVAQVAQSRPVDQVYVDAGTNVGVREAGGRLKVLMGGGERVLHLGLGALRNLTVSELKSILAHEYGHFSHGETRLTPVIARVQTQLMQTIQAMAELGWSTTVNPVWWFLRAYLWVYLQITSGHGRRRELLADRLSALSYGGDTFGRALTRVIENGTAFDRGISVAVGMRQFGRPVMDLYRTIDAAERGTPESLRTLERQELLARQVDKFDSHPPPLERIERVARVPGTRPIESGPAWALFADPQSLSKEVGGEILMNINAALSMRGITPTEVSATAEQSDLVAEAMAAHRAALALDERNDRDGYRLLPIALERLERAAGERDRLLADALAGAAQIHLRREDPSSARAAVERAIRIVESAGGPDDSQLDDLKRMLSEIPEVRAA
ncbi:MAG TPA: M48 family metalloprotease, partial [Myxococcaceae bacterium]|nr:M48 family metalloprotease [Myxococcaceae bacterium]